MMQMKEKAAEKAGEQAPETAVQPPSETAIKRGGTGVTLTFKNASIEEVVDVIMQELGHSYILDPEVAGTVNLFTHQEFSKEKLFGVLEQLLKMNGQAIIRQDDLYVILPIGQSATIPGPILKRPVSARPEAESEPAQGPPAGQQPPSPPPGAGPGNPAAAAIAQQPETPQPTTITIPEQPSELEQLAGEEGVITYIVPLHYIPSADMVTMIKAFVSDGAQVVDFQSANILIITDYRASIEQALEIIRLLDTEYFEVNTVDLVPVRYHQAIDVAEDLAQVFAPGEKAGGVRIVAIERLNSILVVTHAPEVFRQVMTWIDKLDAPSGGSNIRTYVYSVENNTANNIAEILSQLYSDGAGLPSGGGTPEEQESLQVASQERQRARQREESAFLPEQQGRLGMGMGGGSGGLPLGPALGGRAASSGVRAVVVAGDIKIIVNEFNNSLVIQGTEADYQFLRQTIALLDVLPRQVLIEAKIYAVELRDDLSYGVSWFLQDRLENPDPAHPTTGSITRVGEEGGGGYFGRHTYLCRCRSTTGHCGRCFARQDECGDSGVAHPAGGRRDGSPDQRGCGGARDNGLLWQPAWWWRLFLCELDFVSSHRHYTAHAAPHQCQWNRVYGPGYRSQQCHRTCPHTHHQPELCEDLADRPRRTADRHRRCHQ